MEYLCEVCDVVANLTEQEAFDAGWDYPPFMGVWGIVSMRTCPNCPMTSTAWWAAVTGLPLTEKHLATVERIGMESAP